MIVLYCLVYISVSLAVGSIFAADNPRNWIFLGFLWPLLFTFLVIFAITEGILWGIERMGGKK